MLDAIRNDVQGMPDAPAPIHLLIVDDDDGIRTLLEITATLDERFEVVGTASCGAEALDLVAASTQLDVVLLDVTLPDTTGIELMPKLQACAPRGGTTAIVLFTGWSDPTTHAQAMSAGALGVFGKDGDPQGLLNSIAALVTQTR